MSLDGVNMDEQTICVKIALYLRTNVISIHNDHHHILKAVYTPSTNYKPCRFPTGCKFFDQLRKETALPWPKRFEGQYLWVGYPHMYEN